MGRVRILIADDHTMIAAGFQKLLEPRYEVVGCVADGHALLKAAPELNPDIVLLDVAMPLLNGLDAARELRKKMPHVKLVFLTMNPGADIAAEALRIGASAYLLKTSKPSELLQAIHDVVKGNSYVTPPVKRAMGERFIRDPKRPRQKQLTARQREVLQMVAEGRSMMEIANVLQITHRTVRFHKARIMEELEITNNSDLVRYAINHGVISAV
ncbi:MAG: response regulator [Candidatus Korobacteraceae bacterium]|jgi:DNA-binding NarL/FixJ family response regulator